MTVEQLLKDLATCPPESEVFFWNGEKSEPVVAIGVVNGNTELFPEL